MTFNIAQTKQLLAPIKEHRVLKDGKGHSHLSQQDVVAHLIRVFGFGNFTTEVLALDCIAEKPRDTAKTGYKDKWDVAYRAMVRLTIFNEKHEPVCFYEDASIGDAQNQTLGDCHDLAMKSAISLAKKRCAIHLGDQFGLGLYNKGSMLPIVRGTHVLPKGFYADAEKEEKPDLQEGVPKQESLGIDETHYGDTKGAAEADEETEKVLAESLGATKVEEGKA